MKNEQEGDGEWVRPIRPELTTVGNSNTDEEVDDCAYVIALSGEFLQLTSNGRVPTCIHRVLPSKPGRVSAPLFLRPRRCDDAVLNVSADLGHLHNKDSLYFERGLLEECDSMNLWSAHGIMMKK